MGRGRFAPAHRRAAMGLLAALIALSSSLGAWGEAQARSSRHQPGASPGAPAVTQTLKRGARIAKRGSRHVKRVNRSTNFDQRYAAIVVDDNSGSVLHEVRADEPRHPASLAKIMTLYLLFEQLEAGRLKLDTPLQISAYAARQRPVKLGLKADKTIAVEDAIKGLVTKSANDAAVVISEAIAGGEDEFAKLMTGKAKALGMQGTVYVNASGLPADEQITTARDQALLGRAIQHRFPQYFRYFAMPSFRFRGKDIANHNNLLGKVDGVDGIKTGYTDASGYNLVSSVHRNKASIVGVVLGGPSNGARDERMRKLIEDCMPQAAVERTAPPIVEQAGASMTQNQVPPQPAASPRAASAPAVPATAQP